MSGSVKSTNGDYNKLIYNSRQTILELLETRGFNVSDYEGANMNEVHVMVQNKQLDMLLENEETQKKAYVKYHLAKTLRPQNVSEYVEDLFDIEKVLNKDDDLIIIAVDNPNDSLVSELKLMWENNKHFITIFGMKRLQFNILNHDLVPSHSVLSEEEKEAVKQKYNIVSDKQIPEIDRFDPVAKCIGLRPTEMCKIIRPSKTAIEIEYYRICI